MQATRWIGAKTPHTGCLKLSIKRPVEHRLKQIRHAAVRSERVADWSQTVTGSNMPQNCTLNAATPVKHFFADGGSSDAPRIELVLPHPS